MIQESKERYAVITANSQTPEIRMMVTPETKEQLERAKSVVITKYYSYFLPIEDLSYLPKAPQGRLRIRRN